MQLIQTNDKANRQSFRDALQHKVETALNTPPPSAPIVPDQVLLLPHNYEELNAKDLHFNLMHNPELKHSRQSANLAVDIVFGKATQPQNVTFQSIEIKNPVKIPVFATPPVKRGAQRQLTAADSLETKMQEDAVKREEYKQYLRDVALNTKILVPAEDEEILLLLPHNYKELSATDLHFNLIHNPELKQTWESANLTVDIFHGKSSKPDNVKFQSIEIANPVQIPVTPTKTQTRSAPRPVTPKDSSPVHLAADDTKKKMFKQFLADKAEKAFNTKPVEQEVSVRTVLVPVGYESMSDGELHYALVRNPEFKHTNQQAVVTVDMLSGRIGTPENVKFSVQEVETLNLAPVVAPIKPKTPPVFKPATKAAMLARAEIRIGTPAEGEKSILIPHNFADMTETQIHFALSHNREYGHSHESVYEALDMMFGRKAQPKGVVFSLIEVENPIERAY